MNNNLKDEVDAKKIYGEDTILSKDDFIGKYKINEEKGLTSSEVKTRLKNYGLNELKQAKSKKWYNFFLESLLTPFNYILLGIMCLLFYTDVYLARVPSYANIIVIIILVTVSTLLDFVEEFRSNKAAEKLKQMVATTTTVIRGGKTRKVQINKVTVGDIVTLSAGSMIPADMRLIRAKDLYVSQSSLTGESESVKKVVETKNKLEDIDSIADLDNICFMGTDVVSGSARGVVIKTGDNTYFGKIAKSLAEGKPKTAFQKNIEDISKLLIKFMVTLIPIVFLLNIWKHGSITAFTFAVAVAICITPLLLPVILSSCLSKGAVRMSKKKTIVKKLDAIQNFGAMNILCTDKTGTLTEDKIVLEKYLNIKGEEDVRVLKHSFLNAYFQTGLKGNIDEAVIKRALDNGMEEYTTKYSVIDEIPFDFSRRRLSVIVTDGKKKQLITKGAVEEILSICSYVDYQGKVFSITKEIKDDVKKLSKELNEEGLRVIAICQKNEIEGVENFSIKDEKNMVLLGFIGFLDPPKKSAKESIRKLNEAGIRVIVLTGDNAEVTKCVCKKVDINSKEIITGSKVDKLTDAALSRVLTKNNIFVKLSPIQKARIVRLLKEAGNVVGYMGDGINDSPSLTNSDVGISVDSGADVAKEAADIILLEKDLNVLLDGVTEGRRTFVNLMKYIKLSTSFNFGEVVSVIISSLILPFLPETPIQLLVEGLLYDFGQLTIPFDNVDKELLKEPKRLLTSSLKKFMLFMGPVSSAFDLVVFAILWWILKVKDIATFQTFWFTYSIISNLVGMHIIRTSKVPFIQSNAHKAVYVSSILLIIAAIFVPATFIGKTIGLVTLSAKYIAIMFAVTFAYCIVAMIAKKIYIKKNGEWI